MRAEVSPIVAPFGESRDGRAAPHAHAQAGRSEIPRLALSKAEAAEALGVSVDYFEEHIQPELRIVRRGRRRLIAVRELERWLEESSARTLGAA